MKNILLSLSVIFTLAACQHKANDGSVTQQSLVPVTGSYSNSALSDTAVTREAFYQPRKSPVSRPQLKRNLPVAVHRSVPRETTYIPPVETSPVITAPTSVPGTVPSTSPVESNAGAGTASTIPQPEKKGWSKSAKGAVIGAGAGAIGGAILSKKKGLGAVIGGVVGAAGGYIIGKGMDKKDGRFVMN